MSQAYQSDASWIGDLDAVLASVRLAANGESTQIIPPVVQAVASTLKVVHVPEIHIFNVCDGQNHTHVVKLHPNESCTCPASTTCCHILAVRRSIGLETERRKPLILSTLRKNARYSDMSKSIHYTSFYYKSGLIYSN
jgi:hypothetical protein